MMIQSQVLDWAAGWQQDFTRCVSSGCLVFRYPAGKQFQRILGMGVGGIGEHMIIPL